MARKGGQWSDHFERAARAYNARSHETRPRMWRSSQGPPRQCRQVPAQQGPHRPAREGGAGAFRAPTNGRGAATLSIYGDVQRLGAVDSMTVAARRGARKIFFLGTLRPPRFRGSLIGPVLAQKKTLITLKLELPDRAKTLEKGVETLRGLGGNFRSLLSSFLGCSGNP